MDPVFEALSAKLYVREPDSLNGRFAEDEGERAAADIRTLTNGFWRAGYWDPRLREFAEGPGRTALHSSSSGVTWCSPGLARRLQPRGLLRFVSRAAEVYT